MKKATLELSMNFIVTILISIVVLGFGVNFIYRMYSGINKMPDHLNSQITDSIAKSLSSGKRCYIPLSNQKVERKKIKVFGLGVLNTMPSATYFHVDYSVTKFVDQDGISRSIPTTTIKLPEKNKIIKPNEKDNFMIGFVSDRNTKTGTYFIDVKVCSASGGFPSSCSTLYCPTQKIVVTVV